MHHGLPNYCLTVLQSRDKCNASHLSRMHIHEQV